MLQKTDWAKIKIPPFGMSDAMVKYVNGTLNEYDDFYSKEKEYPAKQRNGEKRRKS